MIDRDVGYNGAMPAFLIVLLILLLVFGFWAVVKGIVWLIVILVVAFVVTGVIGGGLLKKDR